MARIHRDIVQPHPLMGNGYDIWLKWQEDEKAVEIPEIEVKKVSPDVPTDSPVKEDGVPTAPQKRLPEAGADVEEPKERRKKSKD